MNLTCLCFLYSSSSSDAAMIVPVPEMILVRSNVYLSILHGLNESVLETYAFEHDVVIRSHFSRLSASSLSTIVLAHGCPLVHDVELLYFSDVSDLETTVSALDLNVVPLDFFFSSDESTLETTLCAARQLNVVPNLLLYFSNVPVSLPNVSLS